MVRHKVGNGLTKEGVNKLESVFASFINKAVKELGVVDSSGNVVKVDSINGTDKFKKDCIIVKSKKLDLNDGDEVAGIVVRGDYGESKIYQNLVKIIGNKNGFLGDYVNARYIARLLFQRWENEYGKNLIGFGDYLVEDVVDEMLRWKSLRIEDGDGNSLEKVSGREFMDCIVSYQAEVDGIGVKIVEIGKEDKKYLKFEEKVEVSLGSYDRLVVSVVEKVEVV